MTRPYTDLTNKQFNQLYIRRYVPLNERTIKANTAVWECECKKCGRIFQSIPKNIRRSKTCGCGRSGKQEKLSMNNHWNWKGTKHIPSALFTRFKRLAKQRNISFNIKIDYLEKLLLSQNFKCALTGKDLIVTSNNSGNASIDRINNSKGYIEGNVQWILKDINMMKYTHTQDYFIELCKAVVDFNS